MYLCNIPSGRHVVGKRRSRSDLPRKTKVTQFDHLGPVAQHVLRFQVPMKEAVFVHIGQALQNLKDDFLNGWLR